MPFKTFDKSDELHQELKEFEERRFKWGWGYLLFNYAILVLQSIVLLFDPTTEFRVGFFTVYFVLLTIGILLLCKNKNKKLLLILLMALQVNNMVIQIYEIEEYRKVLRYTLRAKGPKDFIRQLSFAAFMMFYSFARVAFQIMLSFIISMFMNNPKMVVFYLPTIVTVSLLLAFRCVLVMATDQN